MHYVKTALYILVCLVAISATLFSMLWLYSPDILILQLLPGMQGSVTYKDFIIPAVAISGVIGVVHLLAIFHLLQGDAKGYNYALAGGILLMLWMVLQMMILGSAHWLHFIYLFVGLLTCLVAWQLKGKWAL
jgi:hypothetical protein